MKRQFLLGIAQGLGIVLTTIVVIAVAVAADILTVDKDGTVRLRVSDQGKVTLNTSTTAEGDLRLTPTRAADPTAPLEGDLWYNSTSKTAKLYDGTTAQPVPGKFVKYTVTKSDGNFDTFSTSFVDVPGLSLSFATDYANQNVLIAFTGRVQSGTAGGAVSVDVTLDGASLSGGGSQGFTGHKSDAAWSAGNSSFTFFYTVAAAGNHTLQVQIASNNAAYDAQLQGAPYFIPRIDVIKFF